MFLGRFFSRFFSGTPAAGPDATAQAHQAGEWVEVEAIARCYQALGAFLRRS